MISFNFIHPVNYLEALVLFGLILPITLLVKSFFLVFLSLHLILLMLWQMRHLKRHSFGDVKAYLAPLDGKVVDIKLNTSCPYVDGVWRCISIQSQIGGSVLQYAPIDGMVIQEKLVTNTNILFPDVEWLHWLTDKSTTLIVELKDMVNQVHCVVETQAPNYPGHRSMKLVGLTLPVTRASVIGTNRGMNLLGNITTHLYIPVTTSVKVQVGQKMIAGETVIARELDQVLLSDEGNKSSFTAV